MSPPNDPDLPPEYQLDDTLEPDCVMFPGSREFRVTALSVYCSKEDAEHVIDVIEADPAKSSAALIAVDTAFILGVASELLDKPPATVKQLSEALKKVGVEAPSDWGWLTP